MPITPSPPKNTTPFGPFASLRFKKKTLKIFKKILAHDEFALVLNLYEKLLDMHFICHKGCNFFEKIDVGVLILTP